MFSYYVQIPVHPMTKLPLVKKWGGLNPITETPDMTDAFRKNPDAKTANLAGKINNIIVVDVDKPKKDEIDGARFFSGLMENNEKTLTFKSPSGGRHYYFQYDDEIDLSFLRLRKKRID